MFSLKFKTTCRLEPGTYFYFLGAEDPKDWYKIISINHEADSFTITWLATNSTINNGVADPLTTRLSSYHEEIVKKVMILVKEEDYDRIPKPLKEYPCVQDQDQNKR